MVIKSVVECQKAAIVMCLQGGLEIEGCIGG